MDILDSYSYRLPPELIAQEPAVPRDASRLFVYDSASDRITLGTFSQIGEYLPKEAVMVLNDTRVLPSRILMHKKTGGKVKVLFLVNEDAGEGLMRILADRRIDVGDPVFFGNGQKVTVVAQDKEIFTVSCAFSRQELFHILETGGTMPIPPYIKHTPLTERELRNKYQTVFARLNGSAAAPTASLHFTPELFSALEKRGVGRAFVTLHVGMGTFAPITEEAVHEGKLHTEWYEVPAGQARQIVAYKQQNKPVVAVGTTVVRTLESASRAGWPSGMQTTDIFIQPPFAFDVVDTLITNFHLPSSSLMMLVEAFLQSKGAKRHLVDLYKVAVAHRFRFFSFGDAMLIR